MSAISSRFQLLLDAFSDIADRLPAHKFYFEFKQNY